MNPNDTSHADPTSRADGIEQLSTTQCWELVEARSFGRLAVTAIDGIPAIFPVNYTVHDGSLFIKSAPGSKLMALAVHPVAAFEIDGEDDGPHWSVVLRGSAERLAVDKEIRDSGILRVASASPTPKYNYIRVTPTTVSGRRFAVRAPGSAAPEPAIVRSPGNDRDLPREYTETFVSPNSLRSNAERPVPIPHFPPLPRAESTPH